MPENVIDNSTRLLLNLDATQGNTFANSGSRSDNFAAENFLDAMIAQGNPVRVKGLQDGALQFQGSDSLVVPDHAAIDFGTSSFSINNWMRTSTKDQVDMMLDKRDASGIGYALVNDNAQLKLILKGTTGQQEIVLNSTQFTNNVNTNKWQMVTVNVDRTTDPSNIRVQLLINGQVQSAQPIVVPNIIGNIDNSVPLTIGAASQQMTGTGFNGIIDNVRLVDRVITTEEATRLYRLEGTPLNVNSASVLWHLDEGTAGFAADSVGTQDLTHVNSPTIIQGVRDHAVSLNLVNGVSNDSSAQRLTANNNVALNVGNSDFTISAWIKSDNLTEKDTIIEKMQVSGQSKKGYTLYNDNGRIGLELGSGLQSARFELTAQQSQQVLNSEFNHVSVTVDRDASSIKEVKFYVNGQLITDSPQVSIKGQAFTPMPASVTMGNLNNNSILAIGSNASLANPSNFFNGAIDEVQISKVELSQTQIQSIFNPQEVILGTTASDLNTTALVGTANADMMIGLIGKDILNGGAGNDILIGVNPTQAQPGVKEVDQLTGGLGADVFVLADTSKAFYLSNNLSSPGNASGQLDHAMIKDFNPLEGDKIQLYGDPSLYELKIVSGNTNIYRNLNTSEIGVSGDDLIATVIGNTNVSLLPSAGQVTFL